MREQETLGRVMTVYAGLRQFIPVYEYLGHVRSS
jgi:hypothetical protein